MRLLSKILFQRASSQQKKYSKKTKIDVIRLFTNMGEKKFECVVKRNPTPDHQTPKYAERMSHELVHGLTHHKALKGSVLVVKQMKLILAFGFDRRRLKFFFYLNMQLVFE